MRADHRRHVQTQSGPSAADDVQSAGHAGGEELETLLQWGRERGAQHVLDVATGGGHTALAFASLAARVVAFDLTEPTLQAARAFIRGRGAAGVDFVASDVQALPVRDASFDAVTCRLGSPRTTSPSRPPPSARSPACSPQAARCSCRTPSATRPMPSSPRSSGAAIRRT